MNMLYHKMQNGYRKLKYKVLHTPSAADVFGYQNVMKGNRSRVGPDVLLRLNVQFTSLTVVLSVQLSVQFVSSKVLSKQLLVHTPSGPMA